MSEVSYAERVQRSIRRVLVAARGVEAAGLVARLEAAGIETVAIFDASDAEAPHLDVASWAVPLPASLATDAAAVDVAAALCGLALDAGADGVVPGTELAQESAAARVVANLGLAWVGCTPDTLDALADPSALRGRLVARGVPLAGDGARADLEVVVFGDEGAARACADATVQGAKGAGPWAPQRPGASRGGELRDAFGIAVSPATLAPTTRRAAWDLAARVVAAAGLAGPVVVELVADGEHARVAGIRPGLPAWHALVALGDDADVALSVAAVRVAAGEDLAAPQARTGHGLELHVHATEDGVLEALTLPADVDATVGHAEGEAIRAGTLLLALRAEGPTAGAARVRAHEALRGVDVEGVATDLVGVCEAAMTSSDATASS